VTHRRIFRTSWSRADTIVLAVHGLDLDSYLSNRLVRSSVEREFTIIGEAMITLARTAPVGVALMTQARRIVDFRNQLTHENPSANDERVWASSIAMCRYFAANVQS
jgi:uncharacterized protein with HEPN domain